MTTRPQRRRLGALAAAGLAVVLAACSGGASAGEDVPRIFRETMEDLRGRRPDSEFLSVVLADYEITDAEVHAGRAEFIACAAALGVDAEVTNTGEPRTVPPWDPEDPAAGMALADAAEWECDPYLWLGRLQAAMRDNPQGTTLADKVHGCLAREAEPEYAALTLDQITALVEGGCWQPESDAARLCLGDPEGNLNLRGRADRRR